MSTSRKAQSLFNFSYSHQTKPRTHSTMIKPKSGSNDVVDALEFTQNGSSMILIENDTWHTWDQYHISKDQTCLENASCNAVFELSAIESVDEASELSVTRALQTLDLGQVKPHGLERLLVSVTLNDGRVFVLIADSPRNCFIWLRALQALAQSDRDLTMIPLMVSNRLRSGTLVLGQHVMDDEEETAELKSSNAVECTSSKHGIRIPSALAEDWQYFEQQIDALDHFVQVFCILDSSNHLSRLGDVLRLRNKLNEIEGRIYHKLKSEVSFRGWAVWPQIYEQWWLLHADIAVTHLKVIELQMHLGLK